MAERPRAHNTTQGATWSSKKGWKTLCDDTDVEGTLATKDRTAWESEGGALTALGAGRMEGDANSGRGIPRYRCFLQNSRFAIGCGPNDHSRDHS